MKPFIELGFMPEAFASGTQTCFYYKGNVTLPADFEQWSSFIREFVAHLIERYGEEEVKQWFFEVWNEPNLNFFFDGTQEDYFKLYDVTAHAIKQVNKNLKIGGPATSVNAWIPEFITYCEKYDVPLDFISTHHYPSDDPLSTAGLNGPGKKGSSINDELASQLSAEQLQDMITQFINRQNHNPRDVMYQMTKKAKEEAGKYPLYYTEWNGAKEFDTSYQAAFVAQTISYNEGLVDGYSFWTVSDIYEEMGVKPGEFKNEFGIQTMSRIRKPVYRVFETLHEAGTRRLEAEGSHCTVEVLALTDGAVVTVLVYNHDLERRDVQAETVKLQLSGESKKYGKQLLMIQIVIH